jgi:hypothetical protein
MNDRQKNWSEEDKLIYKHSKSMASFIRAHGLINIQQVDTMVFLIRDGAYKLIKDLDKLKEKENDRNKN